MNFGNARRRGGSEVSTGALIDIMFFLMLFFLIASTVTNPNVIKLLLPQASSSNVISKQSINVHINSTGQYFVGKDPVTLADLQDAIAAATQQLSEPTINLRVDRDVTAQQLVNVLDIGMKLKVKVVLATERVE
ncbi:MAG: biopolymer transporter ExbD [Bacteroidetes bacterium]|nr:biopolymer transporter ExbD [Bacteroidota bacterium]